MTNVISAYSTLVRCEAFKRLLLKSLRSAVEELSRDNLLDKPDEVGDTKSSKDGWLKTLQTLRVEVDDQPFLLQCMAHYPLAICTCYSRLVRGTHFADDSRRQAIAKKIPEFITLVAPGVEFDNQDLGNCISVMRAKAYEKSSKSRADDLKEEIKQLKKENEQLRRELQVHLRAVSDMSYRHLTEMLPIADRVAKNLSLRPRPQSGPDWQALWRDIWAAAATKTDSPLHALYIQSNNRSRGQIQDAGKELFGTLSANMHHFGKVYDPVKHLRDHVPGRILDALRPQEFTTDGNVDWDKELHRFL